MDGWQAVQNWAMFSAAALALGLYYWPKQKADRTLPLPKELKDVKEIKKEVKKEAKKPSRRQNNGNSSDAVGKTVMSPPGDGKASAKKRTGQAVNAQQSTQSNLVDNEDVAEDIDMSTRQFAANMQKAREGIQVKASNKNDTRVKTVKAKSSNAAILSSGSSQADVDEDWSAVNAPAHKSGGVDDMLEPVAAGPASLRITASEKPDKEKVNKQAKKEVIETKKQRQNRKRAEERKQAIADEERERKVLAEQQRRVAREARGEPAKNGISIPAAPVNNPWAEQNAARDAHLPAVDNTGNPVQLLDTLDTESNSSSNQGASTAATSVAADAAPSRFAEDNEYAKAVEESERESGWSEVKSTKKSKKNVSESNGTVTPVAAPVAASKAKSAFSSSSKPVGFQALNDEGAQGDDSEWAA